jgi:hemerythrin-like domain-containing protein
MNLRDLPFHVGDPVDALLAFHRRIERQLAALGAIPARLEERGLDAETSAQAASSIAFFRGALSLHHADEAELLTLLEPRMRSRGEREEFDDVRQRLESEHRQMDATWRSLNRPLAGIAEGVARRIPADLLHYFRAMHSGHIAEEEASLHLFAARALPASDRAALGRGMAARRTRRLRFQ